MNEYWQFGWPVVSRTLGVSEGGGAVSRSNYILMTTSTRSALTRISSCQIGGGWYADIYNISRNICTGFLWFWHIQTKLLCMSEFAGGYPHKRPDNTELCYFFFYVSLNTLLEKQSSCRKFETPWRSCEVIGIRSVRLVIGSDQRGGDVVTDVVRLPCGWRCAGGGFNRTGRGIGMILTFPATEWVLGWYPESDQQGYLGTTAYLVEQMWHVVPIAGATVRVDCNVIKSLQLILTTGHQ